MSIRITLEFQTKIDFDFLTQGASVRLIRLLGNVQSMGQQNWSMEEKVIIDTGNPISMIPYSIWKNIERKILIKSKTKLHSWNLINENCLFCLLYLYPPNSSIPISEIRSCRKNQQNNAILSWDELNLNNKR